MLSYNPKNNARMIVHKRKVFDIEYQKDHSFSKEKILSQLESLFENQLEFIEDPGDEFEIDCKALRWAIEFIKANYPEEPAIEKTSIEELKLIPKDYNSLKRNDIDYIEELLDLGGYELLKMHSIGPIAVARISNALEIYISKNKGGNSKCMK